MCSGAAIYGHNGSTWAKAGTFVDLTTYQHPLEQMDGSTQDVLCNEVAVAIGAVGGNRRHTEGGIRMGGKKFMLIYKDEDTAVAKLNTAGSGACCGKTGTAVVIRLS